MRFLICVFLCLLHAEVHSTPCEDTAYVRLGKLHSPGLAGNDSLIYSGKSVDCSRYMDSLDAQARTGGETGTRYKPKGDPTNGYVLTGLGLAMIAGGAAIANAGDKEADRCREDVGILKICNDRSFVAIPVYGIGILSLVFGVVSLSQAYKRE